MAGLLFVLATGCSGTLLQVQQAQEPKPPALLGPAPAEAFQLPSLPFPSSPAGVPAAADVPQLGAAALAQLQRDGFLVVEGFAPGAVVDAFNRDIDELRADKRFAVAGVGEARQNRVDDTVRVCEQCFVYPRGKQSRDLQLLYSWIEGLRTDLHAGGGMPLDGLLTEGLLAYYPNGGYYRRHLDAGPGTNFAQRAWSYLIYLNKDWSEADGGKLRIFTDGGGEEAPVGAPPSFVDVSPRAGTLVVFDSSRVPHEVLETTSPRRAVVGWFSRESGRRTLIRQLAAALGVTAAVRFGLSAGRDK